MLAQLRAATAAMARQRAALGRVLAGAMLAALTGACAATAPRGSPGLIRPALRRAFRRSSTARRWAHIRASGRSRLPRRMRPACRSPSRDVTP